METQDPARLPAAAPGEHPARTPQTFTRRIDCAPPARRGAALPAEPAKAVTAVPAADGGV